jgi:hypothetical protein
MSVKGWPFLVGRNKALPYQVIVSPQFLSEQALSYVLEHAVIKKDNPPDSATLRKIHGTSAGNISVIFRTFRPHALDVGLEGTGPLTDKSGRVIPLVEGLVVRDIDQTEEIILTQEDLQTAHNEVMKAYRAFWEEDKHFPERVSQPFDLHSSTNALDRVTLNDFPPLVIPKPKPPPPTPPKHPIPHQGKKIITRILVALLLVVVSVTSIAYYRHSNPSGPTANGQASPTAMPTTIPDNNYTQATSGTPVLDDPLNDNSKGNIWDENKYCVFSDGAYHVKYGQPDNFQVCYAQPIYNNFAFQVQMTIFKGIYGGIVFRANQENPVGYRFAFRSDRAPDLAYGGG